MESKMQARFQFFHILLSQFFLVPLADSSSFDLITLGRSEHYLKGEHKDLNENHSLLAISLDQDIVIGVYENSFEDTSILFGWQLGPYQHWSANKFGLETSVLLGTVYGYEKENIGINSPILPFFLPVASLTYSLSNREKLYYSYSIVPVPNGAIAIQYIGISIKYRG